MSNVNFGKLWLKYLGGIYVIYAIVFCHSYMIIVVIDIYYHPVSGKLIISKVTSNKTIWTQRNSNKRADSTKHKVKIRDPKFIAFSYILLRAQDSCGPKVYEDIPLRKHNIYCEKILIVQELSENNKHYYSKNSNQIQ